MVAISHFISLHVAVIAIVNAIPVNLRDNRALVHSATYPVLPGVAAEHVKKSLIKPPFWLPFRKPYSIEFHDKATREKFEKELQAFRKTRHTSTVPGGSKVIDASRVTVPPNVVGHKVIDASEVLNPPNVVSSKGPGYRDVVLGGGLIVGSGLIGGGLGRLLSGRNRTNQPTPLAPPSNFSNAGTFSSGP